VLFRSQRAPARALMGPERNTHRAQSRQRLIGPRARESCDVLRQRAAGGSSPAAPGRECVHAVERIEKRADGRRIAMERIDFDHLAASGTPGTLDAPEPAARTHVSALECRRARRWQILRRVSRGSRAHPAYLSWISAWNRGVARCEASEMPRLAGAATGQIKKLAGRTICRSNPLAPDHTSRRMRAERHAPATQTNWNRLDTARAG